MKKNLTELVFILDRSGSMEGLERDTIGGYNSLLKKQKEEQGEAIVTTVLFDDDYELLHDRINIQGINSITEEEYYVRGSTALLDAVGKTINKIVNVMKHTAKDQQPEKVLFVITTDGMENSSREFSYKKIKALIERQKAEYDWEFIFLGANIDAASEAENLGISANRAATYHSDSKGTALNYEAISCAVSEMRACSAISDEWKKKIETDYINRK